MSDVHVHIDRIRLRAKGIPVETARGIADGLGEAFADALAERGINRQFTGNLNVGDIEIRALEANGRTSTSIRAEIASRLADTLTSTGTARQDRKSKTDNRKSVGRQPE